MKRSKLIAGAVGLLLSVGGLVVVSTPAQAANDCKIYDAWDTSYRSAKQMSNKGCDYYKGQSKVNIYGSITWSYYSPVKAPSPSLSHVWTNVYDPRAGAVYGSRTFHQFAVSPWIDGGYISH